MHRTVLQKLRERDRALAALDRAPVSDMPPPAANGNRAAAPVTQPESRRPAA